MSHTNQPWRLVSLHQVTQQNFSGFLWKSYAIDLQWQKRNYKKTKKDRIDFRKNKSESVGSLEIIKDASIYLKGDDMPETPLNIKLPKTNLRPIFHMYRNQPIGSKSKWITWLIHG